MQDTVRQVVVQPWRVAREENGVLQSASIYPLLLLTAILAWPFADE